MIAPLTLRRKATGACFLSRSETVPADLLLRLAARSTSSPSRSIPPRSRPRQPHRRIALSSGLGRLSVPAHARSRRALSGAGLHRRARAHQRAAFCRRPNSRARCCVAAHGVVSDPHEIANVHVSTASANAGGRDGMTRASSSALFVRPATDMETSGAALDAAALASFLSPPQKKSRHHPKERKRRTPREEKEKKKEKKTKKKTQKTPRTPQPPPQKGKERKEGRRSPHPPAHPPPPPPPTRPPRPPPSRQSRACWASRS